jgi:hypothetical protein
VLFSGDGDLISPAAWPSILRQRLSSNDGTGRGSMQAMSTGDDVRSASKPFSVRLNRMAKGDVAYEVGVESGHLALAGQKVTVEHRSTNAYQREAGERKVVHHQTDISPAILDALARLKSPSK